MSTDLNAMEIYIRELARSERKSHRGLQMGISYEDGAYEVGIFHYNDAVTTGRGDRLLSALADASNKLL